MNLFCIGEYLTPTSYGTVQYHLGGRKPKKKKYHPCNNVYTLAMFKIPDRTVVVVCMVVYTNQSTHHSPTTPDKNKKPGEGGRSSPDKVGRYVSMYFFHSHNIVGCLASIGDSGK